MSRPGGVSKYKTEDLAIVRALAKQTPPLRLEDIGRLLVTEHGWGTKYGWPNPDGTNLNNRVGHVLTMANATAPLPSQRPPSPNGPRPRTRKLGRHRGSETLSEL